MIEHEKTTLSQQEKKWLLEQRITRQSDQKEVLIYPMGAERYLSSVLFGEKNYHYNMRKDIKDKNILIIPGYGNSCFLFAQAGAQSITVYDKDPVTIAWMKAFKKYYHYREFNNNSVPYPSIGELLTALTRWYPPLLHLPSGHYLNTLYWTVNPKALRRNYILYMLSLVRHAIENNINSDFEYEKNIHFYTGELKNLAQSKSSYLFDTAFVPYLLGVTNGIEVKEDIIQFINQLIELIPNGKILVTPSQNTKEFFIVGKNYFVTTNYTNIRSIPGLDSLVVYEDKDWYRAQGLTVFAAKTPLNKES